MTTQLPAHPAEATLHADNTRWTLHLNRDFPQDQAVVWEAITKADSLAKWTPFRPNHDLSATGDVWLTPTDGGEEDIQGEVLEAKMPSSLVLLWGTDPLRFTLTATKTGTALTFAHSFDDRNAAASIAAGWHICLGALALLLAGEDVPSVVGKNAMDYGWEALQEAYDARFEEQDDSPEPMESL